MKQKELVRLIQKIVKIEVKKYLSEIFINNTNEEIKLTEITKKVKPVIKPQKKKIKIKKKTTLYTSNPVLNEILNQTEGGIMNESEIGGVGGDITELQKKLKESQPGMKQLNTTDDATQKREIAAIKTIQDSGVKVDDIPDHVANALTRDYSKLIKHIYNK